jgi:hypothetical protein
MLHGMLEVAGISVALAGAIPPTRIEVNVANARGHSIDRWSAPFAMCRDASSLVVPFARRGKAYGVFITCDEGGLTDLRVVYLDRAVMVHGFPAAHIVRVGAVGNEAVIDSVRWMQAFGGGAPLTVHAREVE